MTESIAVETFLQSLGMRAIGDLDRIEAQMVEGLPKVDCKVEHRFTPGLYIREITMPQGSLITSKIHRTEHPFVISKGRVAVWTEESGVQHLEAPYTGITNPGTRRLLFVWEDTVWTTFHPTKQREVSAVEDEIIEKHINPYLGEEVAECLGLP